MSDEGPSSSHTEEDRQDEDRGTRTPPAPLFITHKVSRLDTLAGLAVRYNVAVADIRRANSLLSDSAMFAKDTILIPTQKMTCGVQYSTWAGMIVAQYGRIGDHNHLAGVLGLQNEELPRHSAALDHLQRYYGTGDSASEPPDFRPGDPDGPEGSVSGTEIELSELDHLGRLSDKLNTRESTQPVSESVEYAGSKSGSLADDRVRRRRASEASSGTGVARESEESGHILLSPPDALAGASPERGPVPHSRSSSSLAGNLWRGSESPRRKETLYERLKRVASQPTMASVLQTSVLRSPDLSESLPPLPSGNRRASSNSGIVRDRVIKKKD